MPENAYELSSSGPEFVNRLHGRVQNESTDGFTREVLYGILFAVGDALAVGYSHRQRLDHDPMWSSRKDRVRIPTSETGS